jgi:hypothetical protein
MITNISLLSDNKRRDIELNRQASLLIHNMKVRKITRDHINNEIIKLPENERDKFKEYLNKYMNK